MTLPLAGVVLAGVVLAAGAGTRLHPLTLLRPKALCPVGGRPLVDLALDRLAPATGAGTDRLAVNAHHHAEQVVAHCRGRATVSVERGQALGTAGALGALREWIAGRDVLLTNADAYLPDGLAGLVPGWDGERCRLLCVPDAERGDFGDLRYVGACLLPWRAVRDLRPEPSGLYEVLWRDAAARGRLDLVVVEDLARPGDRPAVAIDCGTIEDYLQANLHASGGRSVVGAGAVIEGTIERCVVWDGAWVGPDEHLVDAVRAGTKQQPVTAVATPTRSFPGVGLC